MSYISFRGVSTATLSNVAVSKMPSHKKAARRVTEYYVNGRDGALHVDNGLANFELEAVLVLIQATAAARQIINAWADGTGKLILSDQPNRAYRASVIQEIKWTRQLGNKIPIDNVNTQTYYDTAKIVFNCDPYVYEATDTVATFTANGTLTNPGSAEALPMIQVNGSGDVSFSIDGKEIQISGMTAGTPVYIDSETGYVYTAAGAATMTGDFPVIPIATPTKPTCAVTLGTGVTSLVITPHWRWI